MIAACCTSPSTRAMFMTSVHSWEGCKGRAWARSRPCLSCSGKRESLARHHMQPYSAIFIAGLSPLTRKSLHKRALALTIRAGTWELTHRRGLREISQGQSHNICSPHASSRSVGCITSWPYLHIPSWIECHHILIRAKSLRSALDSSGADLAAQEKGSPSLLSTSSPKPSSQEHRNKMAVVSVTPHWYHVSFLAHGNRGSLYKAFRSQKLPLTVSHMDSTSPKKASVVVISQTRVKKALLTGT